MEKNHYFFKIAVILLNLSRRIHDDFKIVQKLQKILYHTCFKREQPFYFQHSYYTAEFIGRILYHFIRVQKLQNILYHTCFLSDVYLFCLAICHMLFSTRVIISAGLCCCLLLLVILLFYLMYLY